MESFYYKIGPVETTKLFYQPIPTELVNRWVEDFKQLDLEDYKVYLGGRYAIDPLNTNDVDICLTGPIYDYMRLYEIMKKGYELALKKHRFFIDIKHYDNIDFDKYPKDQPNFKRFHIMTELGGVEQKIINGVEVFNATKKTYIHNSEFIPKELAVNLISFPMEKQIKRGKPMPVIRLI